MPSGATDMKSKGRTIGLIALLISGCHGSPTEPTAQHVLRAGTWGGADIELRVTDSAAEFLTTRCVRAYMPRPQADVSGNFSVDASMEPMTGPPPPVFPHAVVTGRVENETLIVSARYDDGHIVGPFSARYGAAGPTFYPCPP